MERSINFYREVLGYDKLIYDVRVSFGPTGIAGRRRQLQACYAGDLKKGLGSFGRF